VPHPRPEELLHGAPVVRALAGQRRFPLRVLEPGQRAEEKPVVHLLSEDAPDRRQALRDPEAVRLERHVEVEEVSARAPVEDGVELRGEKARHVQALVLHEVSERVEDEDRNVRSLEPQVHGVGGPVEDLHPASPRQLPHEVVEVLRARHAEVDVPARAVRQEAAHRLAADDEPRSQAGHGAGDGRRHDLRRVAWRRHPKPRVRATASARPRRLERHPGSLSAWWIASQGRPEAQLAAATSP
jgi:hypothetical protein